jgi:HK97 gp10 family phage protein
MMGVYDGNLGYSKEFRVEGIKETLDVFQQLADEIGDKKATSKFLVPAMKKAMAPVLTAARMLVPRDTGLLARNLIISAKRPSSKDKRSKYVSETDTVIAKVSTTPIAAKDRKQRKDLAKSLAGKNIKVNNKKFYESKGYFYDGRAIANEFGTSKRAAKPFLRPAMEGQSQTVVELLSIVLDQKIRQFRSKKVK